MDESPSRSCLESTSRSSSKSAKKSSSKKTSNPPSATVTSATVDLSSAPAEPLPAAAGGLLEPQHPIPSQGPYCLSSGQDRTALAVVIPPPAQSRQLHSPMESALSGVDRGSASLHELVCSEVATAVDALTSPEGAFMKGLVSALTDMFGQGGAHSTGLKHLSTSQDETPSQVEPDVHMDSDERGAGSDPGVEILPSGQSLPVTGATSLSLCAGLAQRFAPEMVSSSGKGNEASASSFAKSLLPTHSKEERPTFQASDDVLPAVESAFAALKGCDGEPRLPLDPPASGRVKVFKMSSQAVLGGKFVSGSGVHQRPLRNDLPGHLYPQGVIPPLPGALQARLESLECAGLAMLDTYTLQDSLVALLHILLFAQQEDGSLAFRDGTTPEEVMTVLQGMLQTSEGLKSLGSKQVASTVAWRRQEVLANSEMSAPLRTALATAPYNSSGLFGPVVQEAVKEHKETAKHSMYASFSRRGASTSSSRGRGSASTSAASGQSFARNQRPRGRGAARGAQRGRGGSSSRGGSTSRGAGSSKRGF